MNSSCSICLDLFDGQDVGATKCGHIFHCKCIFKWMDNSKFCPECRATVTRNSVSKLYFNRGTLPLYPSIQNDLESKKAELKEKETELSVSKKKIRELENHAANNEQLLQSMHQKYLASQSEVVTFKLQLKNVELLEKKIKNLVQENVNLESQVNQFSNIQTLLQGSQNEVDEILNQQMSLLITDDNAALAARNLANLCSISKRELSKIKEQKELSKKKEDEFLFTIGIKNAKIRSLQRYITKLEKQVNNAACSPCPVVCSCPGNASQYNLSRNITPVSTHCTCGRKSTATARIPSLGEEATELVEVQCNQPMKLTPVSIHSTSRRTPSATATNPSKVEKASEITPIMIDFSEKKRPAIKKVVLNNTTEQSMSIIKPVLPFLKPVLNPLKRKPDFDEDSIMRIGYDGLGGHERVIYARSRAKPYKKNPNVKKTKHSVS